MSDEQHRAQHQFADVPETALRRGAEASSLTKPSDGWDALRPQFAKPLDVPEFSDRLDNAAFAAKAYDSIPEVPHDARFRFKGPVPVGIPIELPPGISDAQADMMLVHAWALMYKRIVHDSGLPIILSGRWGAMNNDQAAFIVWIEAGPTRLVVLPTLRRYGRTISVGIAHCVLFHQGWMTAHDPGCDAHWADLSINYEFYFQQPGRAYYEYAMAYDKGHNYWHRVRTWMDSLIGVLGAGRPGWGDGEILFTTADYPGTPVFFSKELHSFFHFTVGEPGIPESSQPGVLLSQISVAIAKATSEWRSVVSLERNDHVEPPRRLGVGTTIQEEN